MAYEPCPSWARYRDILLEVALGDPSCHDPEAVEEAMRHADACPYCGTELVAYQGVVGLLRPSPTEEEVAETAARVTAAVEQRIAAMESRRRLLRGAVAIAAAAAVLLVTVLWRQRDRGTTHVAPEQVARGRDRLRPQARPVPESGPTGGRTTSPGLRSPIRAEHQAKLARAARLREEGRRLVSRREFAEGEKPLRAAIALLEGVLGQAPDGEAATTAHYESYRCYELLGDYLARESSFRSYVRSVREARGDEAAARALLADAHRLIQEHDAATAGQRLEQALALAPAGPVAVAAHVLHGLAAEREGLLDLAGSHYRRAIDLGPSPSLTARVYRNLISTEARGGRLDAAIADAQALCGLPGDEIPLEARVVHQCLLAHLHTRKGDTARSTRVLRDAITTYGPDHTRYAQVLLQRVVQKTIDSEAMP